MRDRFWVAVLVAAFTAKAHAAVVEMEDIRYSVYRLDVADDPAVGTFSRATGSNGKGQVVGYYRIGSASGSDRPSVEARGFTADPDATGSYGEAKRVPADANLRRVFPWDVNDSGTLVGGARLVTPTGFLYAFYGAPTYSIGNFSSLGRFSEAKGVNNLGGAVGYVCAGGTDCLNVSGAGGPSAFYYHPATQQDPAIGFPNLPATASQARAINDQGLIAGSFVTANDNRALRYDWGARQAEDLHPYFGDAVSSEAFAINSWGDVAGRVGFADAGGGSGGGNTVQQAFALAQGSKTPILLETPTGYEGSAAAAIADNGWVVGTACDSGGDCGRFEDTGASVAPGDNTAMLWANGLAFELSLLPGLTDKDANGDGWAELSFAESIVDMGEFSVIAGTGFFQFGTDLQRRAFVLRIDESSLPIPEPHPYAMLAAGLVALGAIRMRRAQRLAA